MTFSSVRVTPRTPREMTNLDEKFTDEEVNFVFSLECIVLPRGGGFGHPRQEECLCLAIHTPYLHIAHCFQHNDIYVYAQPFPQSRKVCCALRVGHRYTANIFSCL